jgi:molybdopterin converting factor small subunit
LNSTAYEEVTLRFLGVFKKAYGSGQTSIKIQKNEKLEKVIKKVSKASSNLNRVLVDPELGNPLSNAIILVNGKEIGLLNGLETMLKDKDKIVFIPVIHGG